MGWFYLFIAIIFEVIGTTQLKRTEGNFFTMAGMLMLLMYAISFYMLTLALKNDIEMGVGYAIWSGVGTALIAAIGVAAFGEQASVMKFLCIGMIIIGVVGLKINADKLKLSQQEAFEADKSLASSVVDPPIENARLRESHAAASRPTEETINS